MFLVCNVDKVHILYYFIFLWKHILWHSIPTCIRLAPLKWKKSSVSCSLAVFVIKTNFISKKINWRVSIPHEAASVDFNVSNLIPQSHNKKPALNRQFYRAKLTARRNGSRKNSETWSFKWLCPSSRCKHFGMM